MRIVLLALAVMLSGHVARAQDVVRPEIVRLWNMQVKGDLRSVYLGNDNNRYVLFCNVKTDGCIKPEEKKNYLLFNANTRWKMPGAKDFLTLTFMQEWTVKYNQGENVGLISEDGSSGIGVFVLDKTGGDPELTDEFDRRLRELEEELKKNKVKPLKRQSQKIKEEDFLEIAIPRNKARVGAEHHDVIVTPPPVPPLD
jgi:hypothetical protein